jgi:hypothetical protein
MPLLAEIMVSPALGEVMFLVALILFAIATLLHLVQSTVSWSLLVAAGLTSMALGWLALATGG